ncbi:histidine--tRNA ligase [Geosporobacter ferrireducens]|uniref:Histidine--tRNA ligase n=1 Tax=Geosporobacter ferrireducens TaxID=1424294 RepID=A0A1D8GFD0_9FIRM|nr:histidine--tRNA ligase [Geosporobacter ferrireducens]AOT69614.1 histidine--tRNA ligase [Geosporobacter ferrireducens]MTI54684.1 histidine--tRNA ligase [Geosporobacter ferrireducens]
MESLLQNLKGTKDFMPEEQQIRNKIRNVLEEVFQNYGYRPLETPILCQYDLLASKYAGGSEILKEVYRLKDQGNRDLGLRYDLTVPFCKVIGANPTLQLPFKRYEIGKVFRDGPVKTGRLREFVQCDVDVVGVKDTIAEAELMSLTFEVFRRLGMGVYIQYNNRKLLTGLLEFAGVNKDLINDVILTMDKIEKIGEDAVKEELVQKGITEDMLSKLFDLLNEDFSLSDFQDSPNVNIREGIAEIRELQSYLSGLELMTKTQLNLFLARGLGIYTGTVFEVFLSDGCIQSSIASGGRYDKIIGKFLDSGQEYPAVGISFGLDVIYTAMELKAEAQKKSPVDLLIIPMGTQVEALRLACALRKKDIKVEIELRSIKLKKSLDYANKQGIPYVVILGEDELNKGCVKIKDMSSGVEKELVIAEIEKFNF